MACGHTPALSYRRKPVSMLTGQRSWAPACAGATIRNALSWVTCRELDHETVDTSEAPWSAACDNARRAPDRLRRPSAGRALRTHPRGAVPGGHQDRDHGA